MVYTLSLLKTGADLLPTSMGHICTGTCCIFRKYKNEKKKKAMEVFEKN